MIESYFDRIERAEAIRFAETHFRVGVHRFHDAAVVLPFGPEPVEDQFLVLTQAERDLLDRLQSAAHGRTTPGVEQAAGVRG